MTMKYNENHPTGLFAPTSKGSEPCPGSAESQITSTEQRHVTMSGINGEARYGASWEEARDIIRSGRVDLLKRLPSQIQLYRDYRARIKEEYGDLNTFILKEKLGWEDSIDVRPAGPPFSVASDMKILLNDWPYGFSENIVHLIVWTKFSFELDADTSDLTERSRKLIEEYISLLFEPHLDLCRVLWFRNPPSLKSVRGVEHFHVLLRDPDSSFVEQIVNEDPPTLKRAL